eukprot:2836566-Alexandrium_andersonii.AAC.1
MLRASESAWGCVGVPPNVFAIMFVGSALNAEVESAAQGRALRRNFRSEPGGSPAGASCAMSV